MNFQNPGSGLSNMAETVNVRHILPHPETVLPKTLTSYDNFFLIAQFARNNMILIAIQFTELLEF